MMESFIMLCTFFIFSFVRIISSSDSITPSQSIRDGETLISAGGTFELGFFSPGNSRNRYLGGWYKKMSPLTVVWVANREIPLNNTSGVLQVNNDGVLILLNATKSTVWSSNTSTAAENPVAQLLDFGNLIVKNREDANEGHLLWQSSDYPGNTLLAGMKLGWNLETVLDRFLSSWKSDDDPSQGEYIVKIDIQGYPQLVVMKGTVIEQRVGSWNGLSFTAVAVMPRRGNRTFEFVLNKKEIYFEFQVLNRSVFSRDIVSRTGFNQWLDWTSNTNSWELVASHPANLCYHYALCGANSICNIYNSPVCSCLKGFQPKNQEEWNTSIWAKGCARIIPLGCNDKDDFRKYAGMKLPDTASSWYNKTTDLGECRNSCLANCSCSAYANLDIRSGGSGCLLWFDDLVDIEQFPQRGQDLYIRSVASEIDHVKAKIHRNNREKKLKGIAAAAAILMIGIIIFVLTRKKFIRPGMGKIFYREHCKNKLREQHVDLPTFDFSIIAKATDNFSSRNKLGEGGFGSVYKGTLVDGQDLTVKKLSKKSGQGLEEFKNEVMLIAKLQRHNLAWRLWTEERPLELMDKFLTERYSPSEVIRCIQVGLSCVQQRPENRPEMSSVVLMLNGEKLLPQPNVPAFYTGRDNPEPGSSTGRLELFSPNEMSLTTFVAR